MAILSRVLLFGVVLTLASALDQWGLFGCPDFKKVADGIPYDNVIALAAYYVTLSMRGPFKVVAAAESKDAAAYNCIQINPILDTYAIKYHKNGTEGGGVHLKVDIPTGIFKGTLPTGLLGVPDEIKERTWTIVNDNNGLIVMKTCKGAFLSHFTSTYVMLDKTNDPKVMDMTALISEINKVFKIKALAKCAQW